MRLRLPFLRAEALALLLTACHPPLDPERTRAPSPNLDVPLPGLSPDWMARFDAGERAFETEYSADAGLGPLYIQRSCEACHRGGQRGPLGVQKAAVVEAVGVTAAADQQTLLPFGATLRPYTIAGAETPLRAPVDAQVRVSFREGPSLLGRGYLEAIADETLEAEALAQSQRRDGISGRVNHLASGGCGRFGDKARAATLDDFAADALQSDLGVTSPPRPAELPNPDRLTDDWKPGVDVSAETVAALTDYVRLLALPRGPAPAGHGLALFEQVGCGVCHVPSLRTRPDARVPALANVDAPLFTDLLLHDMGTSLADGVTEGEASGREWRTAPLLGLSRARRFLHDGRAESVTAAIELHAGEGSEARSAVAAFQALPAADRERLLDFITAL